MMSITTQHYISLALIVFSIGFIGVVLRRNLIIAFMSLELMLNAVNIAFVAFSKHWQNLDGQVASFFVIVLAAAEAAVGLAIVVLIFRRKGSIQANNLNLLKDQK